MSLHIEQGRVVEFLDGGRFVTSVVTRLKGAKLLVLSETDREMNIGAGRVLSSVRPMFNPQASRLELVRALKAVSQRRQRLADQVNIIELWELLEGEGQAFSYEYLASLALAEEEVNEGAAALVRAVFREGLHFKMRPDSALRLDAQTVENIARERELQEARERELAEGAAWLRAVWEGQTPDEPECAPHVIEILTQMAVYESEATEYKWGQKLIEKAGLGKDPLKPFYLLQKLGLMDKHENLDLKRAGLATRFTPQPLEEARRLAKSQAWQDEPERRDLTRKNVITIDSVGSEDFDDALSLEETETGFLLGVHIADVSGLLTPGGALDLAARERGVTIYMPDLRIPMLPETLSEENLSLRQGQARPAFSLQAELDREMNVTNFEFFPSLITVRRRLSYREVNDLVDSDVTLRALNKVAVGLKKARADAGALLMPLPSLNVYLNADGELGVNLIDWESPSRSMVTELMVLTNQLAARFLAERGVAGLYRRQEKPSKIVMSQDQAQAPLLTCLEQRRYLTRVRWDLAPGPHASMGLSLYTNLTSPLRRYIDLMVQRQVRAACLGREPFYTPQALEAELTYVEPQVRRAAQVQSRRKRYWLLRYLESLSPRSFEAVVLFGAHNRWRVFIKELMLEVELPRVAGQDLGPGAEVMIRIQRVNAREDELRWRLD